MSIYVNTPLCKYKDVFGKPGEGAHSYRLFNIAVVDTILTIIGAWLIAKWLKISFLMVFVILMIIGVIMHTIFCVETTLTKILFTFKNEQM